MATRNLTAAMSTAVQDAVVYPALIYHGIFGSAGSPSEQDLRMWTGFGNLSWNGDTYVGGGNLLSISPIEESSRIEAIGFSVTASGMPSDKISLALQSIKQGKPGKVWLALLEPSSYVSLPGSSGNYISADANYVTSDISARFYGVPSSFTPASVGHFFGQWVGATNNRSYRMRLNTNGTVGVLTSSDGIANPSKSFVSSIALPTNSQGVGFDLDVDNGAGGATCTFYYTTDSVNWIELGTAQTSAGTTSIFAGVAPLEIGSINGGTSEQLACTVRKLKIYNGIGGAIAVDFDARRINANSFTGTMSTGITWTLNRSGATPANIISEPHQLIADPYLLQEGKMDFSVIDDNGETCTIALNYESRLIDLFRQRVRRYTHEDQQIDSPGDLGFEYVAGLQDKNLIWGGSGAGSSPVAQPNPEVDPPETGSWSD